MGRVDYAKQTVLVTGASSGIGLEFSRRLASLGSSLVLVARRRDRLEALAAELRASYGVAVHVVPADLALPGSGSRLAAEVASLGVTVTSVVNNAGFATTGPFHEEDLDRLHQELALDVTAVVDLCHAYLGPLRARGDGFLVNVASVAAYQSTPLLAVYGAAKAFVLSFTEALWVESRGTGLRVLALCPGATRTEFFDAAGGEGARGVHVYSAEQVVTTALRALDRKQTPPSVIVGRRNRLLVFLSRHFASRTLVAKVAGRMVASD